MLWLRSLKWHHRCWYNITRKRKDHQVHQCVAAIGGGFDVGAEERRRTCSIDPRTQPVLILRQSSFQLVSVAVCPSTAYSRAGQRLFFLFLFLDNSLATFYTYTFYTYTISLSRDHCSRFPYLVTFFKEDFPSVFCCLGKIHRSDTWIYRHDGLSRHQRDVLFKFHIFSMILSKENLELERYQFPGNIGLYETIDRFEFN